MMTINVSFTQDRRGLNPARMRAGDLKELADMLQKVVHHAETLLGVPHCSIVLLDASGTSLMTLAALPDPEQKKPASLHGAVASWVLEHGELLLLNDASSDARFRRVQDGTAGSILCMPLLDAGRCIGTITASSSQTNLFDTQKTYALSVLAEQAEQAILHARQMEMMHYQANQLEAQMHFAQSLATYLEPEALYRAILSDIYHHNLLACEHAAILRYHANRQTLATVAAWSLEHADHVQIFVGSPEGQQEQISIHDTSSLVAWAAAHMHPMLRGSTSEERGPNFHELATPLVSKDVLYGVLSLKRQEAFTSDELRLMRGLSAVIATALEQVTRHQEMHSEQEATTRDVARVKAKFLSLVTHELRSPLNAINGYLDLTLDGVAGEINEQQREFLQRARAGSEHLYAMLEDLLLISRVDGGQLVLNRQVMDLRDVVENAVEELELTTVDGEVQLEVDMPVRLPRLYADAVRIQQVLRNLLSNALRFTAEGGSVQVLVLVKDQPVADPDEEGRVMKLQVRDTGSGIAPEFLEHIFERFYQVPGASGGRSGGQGLGLAVVKQVVELHGGSVMVESVPGKGSTFTCLLPCLLS